MKKVVLPPRNARWLATATAALLLTTTAQSADYPGWAKVEIFTPINGGIAGLQARIATNSFPDSVTFVDRLFWSRNPGADNYGARISGFLTPTETADYVFFVAADDNTSLYLSTDATPANLKLVAADQGWQNSRTWTGPGGASSGDGTVDVVMRRGHKPDNATLEGNGFQWVGPFENRSDEFLNSPRTNLLTATSQPWPQTDANGNAVIHLLANQKYYFELLYNEGTGGENTGVAWKKVGDPDPENGVADTEILGQNLSIDYGTEITFFTQPQSQTVSKNQPVTFTVFAVGVPGDSDQTLFTYEWLVNGQPVSDQPNGPSYTITAPTIADTGKKFSVRVTTAGGIIGTSAEATLTVVDDTVPPTISKIHSSDTFTSVIVTFSEAVQDSAVDPANYVFSGGLTVSEANFAIAVDDLANPTEDHKSPTNPANRLSVILFTSKQTEGAVYDLTVNNIKDITGNAMTAKTAKMYANVFRAGQLNYKLWDRGPQNTLPNLINAPGDDPLRYAFPTIEGTRTTGSTGDYVAGNYVDRIDGFFIPPVTTNYVFLMSADNDGYLYLSTDADPVNRKMIAADVGWQNTSEWTGPGGDDTKRRGDLAGGGPFENRSDEMLTSQRAQNGTGLLQGVLEADGTDPDPWPNVDANGNAVISLTAGQRYYIQLWHREGDSGRAEFTYKYSGELDPTNGIATRVGASVLGSYVDPVALPPIITAQPTNITFNPGATLNFSVTVDSALPVTYQWYKDNAAIANQTNNLLTVNNATVAAIGSYFVAVTNANGGLNSAVASAITVVTPPGLTFQQDSSGMTVIEAEHYFAARQANDGHVWIPTSGRADSSGNAYMAVLPDAGANAAADQVAVSARLDFKIVFNAPGTNYVWLRGGDPVAGGGGDSCHVGLDAVIPASGTIFDGPPGFNTAAWNWNGTLRDTNRAFVVVPTAGEHTFSVWMREDGFLVDKVVLTTDSAFTPTGTGPAESQQAGGNRPTISIGRNGAGDLVITYTGTLESAAEANGSYAAVPGASGGTYTVNTQQAARQFYRAKQ